MLVHWPVLLYDEYYSEARRHAEDDPQADLEKAWSVFVTRCRRRWKFFLGCCAVYNDIIIGLLSAFPGVVDMIVISGIVCLLTSTVCSAAAVLLRIHLKEHKDPVNGKVWLVHTAVQPRWTSIPLLFAIPDAWFVWASSMFVVFFVAFSWERLAQGSSAGTQNVAETRFYIFAATLLSVLAASGVAHVLAVLWACHRLDGQIMAALRPQRETSP
ncbi:uncharacterized protein B0H18DRAFT_1118326 [Fomitopsis serialis]|uniref:uncharacterized protein n=1 Tax=Fomitopsis serialis TaxID=139415 RepID=UPI00200747B9|nr:uncharacterized protein B0H18DRAFT_1118326 [Neoantrodia serialis]KAH9927801.1 hypothetical protein B0H18DRAFT_1118326 [Neoantrodia serialis]